MKVRQFTIQDTPIKVSRARKKITMQNAQKKIPTQIQKITTAKNNDFIGKVRVLVTTGDLKKAKLKPTSIDLEKLPIADAKKIIRGEISTITGKLNLKILLKKLFRNLHW